MKSDVTKFLAVNCDTCFSGVDEKCTQPTDTGRKTVEWVHYSREHKYITEKGLNSAACNAVDMEGKMPY